MSVSYTCPHDGCGVTLKTANPVAPGKRVKCPKCQQSFAPVPEKKDEKPAGPGTFKFADDDGKKKKTEAPPAPAAEGPKKTKWEQEIEDEESDESIKKGYGVVQETQEEIEKAEEAKIKFGAVEDKYKKSARGPAVALLVMPSNLLVAVGLIAAVFGMVMFVKGMWPVAFNDAPLGDEETENAIVTMLLGVMVGFWGAVICFGASQMQELKSYMWAMLGAVMAAPLLVGVYAIIMLTNPKVKDGFAESDAGAEDEEDKEEEDEEGDEEEDEDEESDDEDD